MITPSHVGLLYAVGLLTFAAGAGAEPTEPDSSGTLVEAQPESTSTTPVDRLQATLSRGVVIATKRVDRFFGEAADLEEAPSSYLRLQGSVQWADGDGWHFKPNVRFKADFPKTKRRWSLLFSGSTKDEGVDVTGPSDEASEYSILDQSDEDNSMAALNYNRRKQATRFDIRVGIKSSWRPFTELRCRVELFPPEQRLFGRITEALYWVAEDGIGLTSRLELNCKVSSPLLLRWPTRVTISETSAGFDWHSGVTLVHGISSRTAFSYEAGVMGQTEPYPYIREYAVGARLRRDMRRQWLYFELAPEITWPKDVEAGKARRVTRSIRFEIEIYLGERGST